LKILHLCLGNYFADGHIYQENLLTKYHKRLGHDVEVIASTLTIDEKGKVFRKVKQGVYLNEHSVLVKRLNFKFGILGKFLRIYKNLYKEILKSNPDIIFIHNPQFWDVRAVIKYLKHHPNVRVYVDNHADFYNSAKNWFSRNILHKIIWKKSVKRLQPYVRKFYATTPGTLKFLNEMYNVPVDNIELLPLGGDDDKILVDDETRRLIRTTVRKKYNILDKDFLIITGGKIDNMKAETILLMKAISKLKNDHVRLLIFGSVSNSISEEFHKAARDKRIKYIGWINPDEIYKLIISANLAVFPGSQSVLWIHTVCLGIPAIFKYWEGMLPLDLGGNCLFLYNSSEDEIYELLKKILEHPKLYERMKKVASEKGPKRFLYSQIAKRSIEEY
jgi:glycosyltransferase involved in cell wall biosynthesis